MRIVKNKTLMLVLMSFALVSFNYRYMTVDGLLYGFRWVPGQEYGFLNDISERKGDKSQVKPRTRVMGRTVKVIHVFRESDSLLRKLIVPRHYTLISRFWNFQNLETVVLPSTLDSIVPNAFKGCVNIRNFLISKKNRHFKFQDGNLLHVKDSTLLYSVNGADIPEGTRRICEGALANRRGISEVYVPNSVVSIQPNAFGTNSCIKTVIFSEDNKHFIFQNGNIITKDDSTLFCMLGRPSNISSDVRILRRRLFYGREDIDSINVPEGVTRIDNECFCRCYSLMHASLPKSLRVIGWHAFEWTNIVSLEIPEGVESIDGDIGHCTKLESVSIPKSMKEIPRFAFYECRNLKVVYLHGKDIKIGENAFPEDKKVVFWNRKDIRNNQPEDEVWVVYN